MVETTRQLYKNPPLDVFVHIPKTGGTSLDLVMAELYGPTNTFIFTESMARFFRADRRPIKRENPNASKWEALAWRLPKPVLSAAKFALKQRSTTVESAIRQAGVISGHFAVNAFDLVAPERERRYLTVVRDPRARMVSNHRYLRQRRAEGVRIGVDWQTGQNPDLSFADFALSEPLRNFQTRYTGGDFSRFAIVGTTGHLGAFMTELGLTTDEATVPHANRGTWPADSGYELADDPGFQRDFEQFHSLDYAFYLQAVNAVLQAS